MNAQALQINYHQEISPLRVVKEDQKSFTVRYLKSLNLITVVGWSTTDDAWIKYCQLLADVESHLKNNEELKVYFKLEIFNASSLAYLFKIIKRLNKAHSDGKDVRIYWNSTSVETEAEMVEAAKSLAEMCDFQFQITCA